jgi:sulfatase modifying factor 1
MVEKTTYSEVSHRLKNYSATARYWLEHRPAPMMFRIGLALGGGFGALALLGVGGWWGMGLCLLLLGAAVPWVSGAEPVMREVSRPQKVTRPSEPVWPELPQEELPPPEPTIRVVEDIPGLLEMVELPRGTFWMGSAEEDEQAYSGEKPQHLVTVSSFAVGRYPVTSQLYRAIVQDAPRRAEADKDDRLLPITRVSWFDAVAFCNTLSERQGLMPCYRIEGQDVTWDRDANGYRLPTEAEWEYAARAGTTTPWFCGDEPTELGCYAWFDENSGNQVHPVGKKDSNPWGLHDMAGNVWEWCWDRFGDYSKKEAVTDPRDPESGVLHVLRGGAYLVGAWVLRSAFRGKRRPEERHLDAGLRVVRRPVANLDPLTH